MRPSTLLRLAFSGSLTDRVRAGLTVVAAAFAGLAILATSTVVNMAPTETFVTMPDGFVRLPTSWRYTTTLLNETGLRPGLIAMVAATIIPALFLIAQSARLGGPARDHRLASMRLAGATPRQCRAIAAAEQGITVGIGALLAVALFPLLRALLHRPTMEGIRQGGVFDRANGIDVRGYTGPLLPLPTDTSPVWWSWVAVALGMPVLAALLSVLVLRGLVKSPLAAARRVRRVRPRLWPAWLIAGGLVAMAACRVWIDRLEATADAPDLIAPYATMVAALAAVCIGVPLCAAGIGYLGARVTLRYARRPSTLIAARRVLADPYAGSRAVTALLVCTVLVAGLVRIGLQFDFSNEIGSRHGTSFGDAELNTLVMNVLYGLALTAVLFAAVGLLIALVDAAMTRRRTEAALLASGTPNAVLVRSRIGIVLLTAVPGVLLGLSTGYAALGLGIPPAQQPASVAMTCYGLGGRNEAPAVPCTAEGVAQQQKANTGSADPAYSYIEYRTAGPWRNVHPPVPWGRLGAFGGAALLAVALATALSLLIGRRSGAVTALRTT